MSPDRLYPCFTLISPLVWILFCLHTISVLCTSLIKVVKVDYFKSSFLPLVFKIFVLSSVPCFTLYLENLTVLECTDIAGCTLFNFYLPFASCFVSGIISLLDWHVEKFSRTNRTDTACYLIIILPALFCLNVEKAVVPIFCYNLKRKCISAKYRNTLIQWVCHPLRKPSKLLETRESKQLFQPFIKDHKCIISKKMKQ